MDTIEESGINPEGLTDEEVALLEQALIEAHEKENILPENSPSLLVDDSTSRFSSAVWFNKIQEKSVILAGLGGIGSYVAYLLGRFKIHNLTIYDDDVVEAGNLSGQMFTVDDIGRRKTDSVCTMLNNYSEFHKISSYHIRFTNNSMAGDIMICGFDNMVARKQFFCKWVDYVNSLPTELRSRCLFIDGRLAAEEFQVFCIKGDCRYLINRYSDTYLFDDSQAEETLCSYKQTSFCSNMIASVMANLFVNFVANECNPLIERALPFYTYYNAETMKLKTEWV